MRALKLLVIVLGVLLAAGVAALAVALVLRLNHGANHDALAPVSGGGSAVMTLPPGAKIVSTETSGGRLVARIDLPGGGVELIIFDLANGARIATIDLAPQQR